MTVPPTVPPTAPPAGRRRWLGLVLALVIGSLVMATIGTGIWAWRASLDRPKGSSGGTTSNAPQPMPSTAPALARFYDQKMTWKPCGNGHKCAKLTVPLDYAKPTGADLQLAVLKVPAYGEAIGSLVVNPGGPGGSGVEYASAEDGVWPTDLLDSYDIVGFDPRGVGRSDPLHCMTTEQTDRLLAFDPDPDTKAEGRTLDNLVRLFGQGCLDRSGALARHMSTVEVAKDLDILRQVLGHAKLDYFGASYGTFIGATYANLFPDHVGRMVLDGAVDPALSNKELSLQQAHGFEVALRAYAADCVKRKNCVLGATVDEAAVRVRTLLDDIERSPLPTDSSRKLEVGNAMMGIWLPLYVKDYWPLLTQALAQAINKGNGSRLLELADYYSGRGVNRYNDNSMEVLYAVNCLDHSDSIPTSKVPSYFPEFEKASPTFGKAFAYSLSTCASWPIKSGQVSKAMAATGAPPIVVIGTTRDPATPYAWAQALAGELSSGVLISRDGDGHTGFNQGNSCVDKAVTGYLIDGKVPKDGLSC